MAKDLTARVQANAEAQKASPNTPQARAKTLRDLVHTMGPEIAKALPRHMDPERIARIALTLINTTPGLAACTRDSFAGALMTASQLGLEPGPLGEAYLVPYGTKCTLIIGYRGYIKLAWQSNQLRNIDAHVVYDGDEFEYEYGLNPILRHKPGRTRRDITDIYAVASFINGGSAFVVLSPDEVEEFRRRSATANAASSPWKTDWNAMAKKTAVRQLAKWLPMSPELRNFATAAALDESVRTDTRSAVDEVVPVFIEGEYEEQPTEQPAEQGLRDDDPDLSADGLFEGQDSK